MTSIFFFIQYIIKQLLDSVDVISRIIKVEVRVISLLSLWVWLINLTSTLLILDITKTLSNNNYCLLHCLPLQCLNPRDRMTKCLFLVVRSDGQVSVFGGEIIWILSLLMMHDGSFKPRTCKQNLKIWQSVSLQTGSRRTQWILERR